MQIRTNSSSLYYSRPQKFMIVGAILSISVLTLGIFNLLGSLNIIFEGLNFLAYQMSIHLIITSLVCLTTIFVASFFFFRKQPIQDEEIKISLKKESFENSLSFSISNIVTAKKNLDNYSGSISDLLPNEMVEMIFNFLSIKELAPISQISVKGALFLDRVKLSRAQEYGYRGKCTYAAKKYLFDLFLAISELGIKDSFPKKYQIISGVKDNFYINAEATLRNTIYNGKELKGKFKEVFEESIAQGRASHVYALLILGADPHILYQKKSAESVQLTVLMWAASEGYLEIVEYLIDKKFDINTQNNDGYTALMLAASKNQSVIVSCLVKHQADVNIKNNNGTTALILAASKNHGEIVRYLLENHADVNIINNDNNTALIAACDFGNHIEIVEYLVDHNADMNVRDRKGMTALIKLSFYKSIYVKAHEVQKALSSNFYYSGDRISLIFLNKKYEKIVKYLVDHNADLNIKDNKGKTALIYAARGELEIVKYLVDHNADLNIKDNDGLTALMEAAMNNKLEIVKYLVDYNADLNMKDNNEKTALMWAYEKQNPEIIKYLNGCNPEILV